VCVRRRQRLRSSVGRECDARFRAASIDLLQSSQKYSVESSGSRFAGGGGGYGGESVYEAGGAGPGSSENEYAYVWETLPPPDDVVGGGAGGRRLDHPDTMLAHHHHVQHCPASQKPAARGPAAYSRQTSLAPSGEYETTAATPNSAGVVVLVGRPGGLDQNLDDSNKQFAPQFLA